MSGRKATVQTGFEKAAENRAREAAEAAARDRKHYGDALPAVLVLRQKGFGVHYDRGQIHVGNAIKTRDEIKAMAARYGAANDTGVRRVKVTATGLKIGQVVELVPRAKPGPSPTPRRLTGAAAATHAKAAEHSTDLGTRPRVVWLDLGLLTIDKRYQREIGQAGTTHINRILRDFNWNRFQPLIVSEKDDGSYAVIDGQHRLEAAKKHPLIAELPCYIIDAPDLAAQASIFVSVNTRRLALSALQKFWAGVAAGDGDAKQIHKLCTAAGVTILRNAPSYDLPAKSIYAASTLAKVLPRLGPAAISMALGLLAEAHPAKLNVFRAPTMLALATIAKDKVFSRSRTAQALKKLDLDKLYDDSRRERVTRGGTLETATERVLRRHFGLQRQGS